jgi:hypothetical protein
MTAIAQWNLLLVEAIPSVVHPPAAKTMTIQPHYQKHSPNCQDKKHYFAKKELSEAKKKSELLEQQVQILMEADVTTQKET